MRKFVVDMASSTTANVVSAGFQFALQVILVRMLGIETYGTYVSAVAIVSFVELAFLSRSADLSMGPLGKLWFTGRYAEVRSLSSIIERKDARWVGTIFALFFALGIVISPILKIHPEILLPLATSIIAQSGYGVSKSLLIISGSVRTLAKVEMLMWGSMLSFCLAGAYLMGVTGVIAGVIGANIVKTLYARTQSRRAIPLLDEPTTQSHHANTKGEKRQTVQSVLRNIFSGATEHTDTLILNAVLGPAAAGTYRLSKSLASLPARVASPMWIALRPRIAKAWSIGTRQEKLKAVASPAIVMLCAMALFMPVLWIYADSLVQAIYGTAGTAVAIPFLVLLFGTWCYQSVTAWYRTTMLMDDNKSASTTIFALTWISVAVFGGLFGHQSPLHMAYVVATTYVLASILCWITTFCFRHERPDVHRLATPDSQNAGS